jgi:hypothetical protein
VRHADVVALWIGLTLCGSPALAGPPRIADHAPLRVLPATAGDGEAAAPAPMRLAENLGLDAVRSLRPAAEGAVDAIEAMKAWNAAHHRPVQVGFSRPFVPVRMRAGSRPRTIAEPYQRTADGIFADSVRGDLVWGTHLRAAWAHRLRLHLGAVDLPSGSRLWVWGLGEEPRAFGLELLRSTGDLWTPSTGGEDVFLEVEIPAGAAGAKTGFEIRELGEILPAMSPDAPDANPAGACVVDATCVTPGTFDAIAEARKAVAHLEFLYQGFIYECSGGLLNDDGPAVTPYLLTASHCFSTQTAASTLEAFWDFQTPSCGGKAPDLSTLPRSNGSTLLATGEASDFTFVRLNAIPPGRALLGWTATPPANGTTVYRLSHPSPGPQVLPQSFERGTVDTAVPACSDSPRPGYLYSFTSLGGDFEGSSGGPLLLAGGLVAGQLSGGCGGDNPDDGCDRTVAETDGAFAVTYPSIVQFLKPSAAGPCVPDATTLCLDGKPGDRRFKVQVGFQTQQGGGLSGQGTAVPLSSLGITSGGLFWLFNSANPEMLIKILDACAISGNYWVFSATATNAGLTTTVTDTVTGTVKTYHGIDGQANPPVEDTAAFRCN